MTDDRKPNLSDLEAAAASAQQTSPAPADQRTLAVQYADSVAGVDGVRDTHEFEYSVRDCLHSGNCPCPAKEYKLGSDYIQFADGSVYCESLAGPYDDLREMEQAMQVDDENARYYSMGHDW